MSALCHKQTFRQSFDYLVGGDQQAVPKCSAYRAQQVLNVLPYDKAFHRASPRSAVSQRLELDQCGIV
jgi:hypothetical protein